MQDGLGVGARPVAVPGPFERRAQRGVVVDLAVEDDPERAGLVGHRLVAALDVDDAQTPMAQMSPGVVIEAEIVRAAMADRVGHSPQGRSGPSLVLGRHRYKSGNPAHALLVAAAQA